MFYAVPQDSALFASRGTSQTIDSSFWRWIEDHERGAKEEDEGNKEEDEEEEDDDDNKDSEEVVEDRDEKDVEGDTGRSARNDAIFFKNDKGDSQAWNSSSFRLGHRSRNDRTKSSLPLKPRIEKCVNPFIAGKVDSLRRMLP